MNAAGPGKLMRIHIGENDRFRKRKLYEEIVDRCRQADLDLVAVYRGIEGYGASSRIHRPGMFGRSKDAPIVVTIVGSEEKILSLAGMLDELVDEGLIALSSAEIIRFGTAP